MGGLNRFTVLTNKVDNELLRSRFSMLKKFEIFSHTSFL